MARPLRIQYPGAVYHITSRGNGYNKIFIDDEDREGFLKILARAVSKYDWICHAYCLMDNHYHLLIETPRGNLCKGMRHLNGIYTQIFNCYHRKVGHILQGRYKAIIVDKDNYLLELSRYIVLNPVRAGKVKHVVDYRWSSYRATVGMAKNQDFLNYNWILQQFSEEESKARKKYSEFISDRVGGEKKPWEEVIGQIYLGDKNFINSISELIEENKTVKEVPRVQRNIVSPKLDEIFSGMKNNKINKSKKIVDSHLKYGYTQKEIADYLEMHYSSVSKIIKKGIR